MNEADSLIIGIPTADGFIFGQSISILDATAQILNKKPTTLYSRHGNLCTSRANILGNLKKVLNKDSCRMLWIDSDIVIMTQPHDLAKCLQEADEKQYNIVAAYRRETGQSTFGKVPHQVLRWEEVPALEQYEKMLWAGLGFYYGYTPLNYKFHMDDDVGEDEYFFEDNKIEIRVDKRIVLYHNKRVLV